MLTSFTRRTTVACRNGIAQNETLPWQQIWLSQSLVLFQFFLKKWKLKTVLLCVYARVIGARGGRNEFTNVKLDWSLRVLVNKPKLGHYSAHDATWSKRGFRSSGLKKCRKKQRFIVGYEVAGFRKRALAIPPVFLMLLLLLLCPEESVRRYSWGCGQPMKLKYNDLSNQ